MGLRWSMGAGRGGGAGGRGAQSMRMRRFVASGARGLLHNHSLPLCVCLYVPV